MKSKIVISLCLLIILLSSCIDHFNLLIKKKEGTYIVEGLLSDTSAYQYVRLKQTSSSGNYQPISNADIWVEKKNGQHFPFYEESTAGLYQPTKYIPTSAGDVFRLGINLGDSVNILSDWEEVPMKTTIDSSYYLPKVDHYYNKYGILLPKYGFDFYISTGNTPSKNTFLRYDYVSAYELIAPDASPLCPLCNTCYIKEYPSNYLFINSATGVIGKPLKDQKVLYSEADYTYSAKKTFHFLQFSINENAYEYQRAIYQQQTTKGTIFDPPPAVVTSNLKDQINGKRTIYGFFEVSRLAENNIVVRGSEAPFRIQSFTGYCQGNVTPYGNRVPSCSDCREAKGSKLTPPSWY